MIINRGLDYNIQARRLLANIKQLIRNKHLLDIELFIITIVNDEIAARLTINDEIKPNFDNYNNSKLLIGHIIPYRYSINFIEREHIIDKLYKDKFDCVADLVSLYYQHFKDEINTCTVQYFINNEVQSLNIEIERYLKEYID